KRSIWAFPAACRQLAGAEQILWNTRRVEDEVARSLELAAQTRQVDVEQPPLPLANLARDDHGLDVGAVHQRDDRAGHIVQRRDIERGSVEDDDVRLFPGRERAG